MMVSWVLLDTMSIQQYIFSSNKLKENLGASFLVKDIYEGLLREALIKSIPSFREEFVNQWKVSPDSLLITEKDISFEIGYTGGGNALLFFKNKELVEKFLKAWTTLLLLKAPGIRPAIAIGEYELKDAYDESFSKNLERLFFELAENKNKYIPQTVIPRHGITAECPRTGYSAESWGSFLPKNEQRYISSVSYAKLKASKDAKDEMEGLLEDLALKDKYIFPEELEKLGQIERESHIAIVHIDGNGMGERFKAQKTLSGLRRLSKTVSDAVEESFKDLILRLTSNLEKHKELNLQKEDSHTFLPIRPIIIGGDDITFVCEGRLGIYLAREFIESFERKTVSDGMPLSACAGIAITKIKYPFYRGYKLAEDLCRSAKKERRGLKDSGSWLDWHILKGSITEEIESLRQKDYTFRGVQLCMRPYSLKDFNELLKTTAVLNKMPRSKRMTLREVLYKEEAEQEAFLKLLQIRKYELPAFKDFNGRELIRNSKTPYLDMIELIEFYPSFALEEKR